MKQSQGGISPPRALMEKPPFAVLANEEGQVPAAGGGIGPSRQARIREAAYALYEARGHVHGHDVDDWLAAESSLAGAPVGAAPSDAHARH